MINTYYPSYNYNKSNLPFSSKQVKVDRLLKDFARDINLTSASETILPKEFFKGSPNYKYINEVKLQLVKPERGTGLPGNHRALNLVVNSKKDGVESSDRTWLKTGEIQELKEYLKQKPTEVHIKTKVATLLKEAFEDFHTDY